MHLVLLLFVLSTSMGFAAVDSTNVKVPSTIDVIETSVRDLADTLLRSTDVVAGDALPLSVNDHPDAPWIRAIIAQRFDELGRSTIICKQPNERGLDIVVMDLSTRYKPLEQRDSVEREVVVRLETMVQNRRVALTPRVVRHVLSREDAVARQSMQHSATHAPLPQVQRPLWDELLEPLIYIAAAAVTVVLLFTVRTQ